MTKPAAITQNELARTFKSLARAGYDQARVVQDLANRRIEVIIGEPAAPRSEDDGDFDDEDI